MISLATTWDCRQGPKAVQVWADGDTDDEVLGMVVRTGQSHCLCKHDASSDPWHRQLITLHIECHCTAHSVQMPAVI